MFRIGGTGTGNNRTGILPVAATGAAAACLCAVFTFRGSGLSAQRLFWPAATGKHDVNSVADNDFSGVGVAVAVPVKHSDAFDDNLDNADIIHNALTDGDAYALDLTTFQQPPSVFR